MMASFYQKLSLAWLRKGVLGEQSGVALQPTYRIHFYCHLLFFLYVGWLDGISVVDGGWGERVGREDGFLIPVNTRF